MAIERPITDIKKLLMGTILNIIPIVNFVVLGYWLRCAKTVMDGNYDLPEWRDWGDLFVGGIIYTAILILYSLVILIFSIAPILLWQMGMTGSGGGGIILNIMFFLTMLLAVGGLYILPSILMTYVLYNFKFGSIFKLREIIKKTFNKDYLITWIVMGLYSLILLIALSFVPLIGSGMAIFAAGVTSMTAFADIYPKHRV